MKILLNKKEMRMKKIFLIFSLLLISTLIGEEFVEPVENQASAVDKVMERFSKLSTIESTPIEDNQKEQPVDTTTIVSEELDMAETIQTAKFESKEMPYPEDKKAQATRQPIQTDNTEVLKNKSLRELEANARKVIEEELQKVEDAKANALERINSVMEQVERAKSN